MTGTELGLPNRWKYVASLSAPRAGSLTHSITNLLSYYVLTARVRALGESLID